MKKTSTYLRDKKRNKHPITMLTCYDYPMARWQDEANVDVIFVGDSVGTNVLGYESERDVTLADIRHHLRAVRRGLRTAYLLADLPYRTYNDPADALRNARARLEDGADGVKLEGHKPEVISHLVTHGIEVCAHLGLNPQIHKKKGLQARSATAAVKLLSQSVAVQQAGSFMLVYELVPEEVAAEISKRLYIPTIGIGAGRFTDGQVLIALDMLGTNTFELRHSRKFEEFARRGTRAIRKYVDEVVAGHFPGPENVRHLSKTEAERFKTQLGNADNRVFDRRKCNDARYSPSE